MALLPPRAHARVAGTFRASLIGLLAYAAACGSSGGDNTTP